MGAPNESRSTNDFCETQPCRPNDFGKPSTKGWNSASKSSPLNCKVVDFPVGAYYGKDARTLTPAEPKSSPANSPPLVLMRHANTGAPNRDQFGLVQYPHNTQKPGNSGNRHQKGEYHCLSPIEVIVL